jgi:hypothetical protein
MKQVALIYIGLLILGLLATLVYGMASVWVASLSGQDIHIAGILSIENGPPVTQYQILALPPVHGGGMGTGWRDGHPRPPAPLQGRDAVWLQPSGRLPAPAAADTI